MQLRSVNRCWRHYETLTPLRSTHLPLFPCLFLFYLSASLLLCPISCSQSRCASVPPHRFNPRSSPSPSTSLTFCTSYSSSTCCNASHTAAIVRDVYPFFSFTADDRAEGYGVSEECKNLASSIYCHPCHPLVGTQQKHGVCRESCEAWYAACSTALFEEVNLALQPCSPSSLICTPLQDIVRSGEQFCRAMGVPIGLSSLAPSPPSSAIASPSSSQLHDAFHTFITDAHSFHATKLRPDSSDHSHDDSAPCFIASAAPVTIVPTSKRPPSASSSSPPSSSSSSTSPTSGKWSTPFPWSTPSAWRGWLSKAVRRQWRQMGRRGGVRLYALVALVGGLVASGAWVVRFDVLPYLRRKGWIRGRLSAAGLRQQRIAKLSGHSR